MIVLVNFHEAYPDLKSHVVRALNPEQSPFVHCTMSFLGEDDWVTANLTDTGVKFYEGRPDDDDTVSYLAELSDDSLFAERLEEFTLGGWRISWAALGWYVLTGRKPAVLCTNLPFYCLTGSHGRLTLNELAEWCASFRVGRGLPYRGEVLADRVRVCL